MLFQNIRDLKGNKYTFSLNNFKLSFLSNPEAQEYHFKNETFVSPGWIDIHTHCNPLNKFVGSKPDEVGYKTGVCMVVDAGSVGIDNLDELFLIQKDWKTNIRALLNISRIGIPGQYELNNLEDVVINYDQDKYKDFVIGYKGRISGSVVGDNGVEPLKRFNKLREKQSHLPLMVHLGNTPPSFAEIVENLQDGDIMTHVFNGKNQDLFQDSKFTPDLQKAFAKGLKTDVGHGTSSFDGKLFSEILKNKNNFKPDFISTDIYEGNIKSGIVKDLATTMSKMHALGMSWVDVIDCVTINPARHFALKNFGEISEYTTNLTFFEIQKTENQENDSKLQPIKLTEKIVPVAVILNGEFIELTHKE